MSQGPVHAPVPGLLDALPCAPKVWVLHPGDVACGTQGDRFETLLGSCVSIILTDPRRTVGAMCHFVHAPADAAGPPSTSTLHADAAMRMLYRLLRGRGVQPRMCQAFVYGGGNMFPGQYRQTHVGDDNARWALQALADEGIAIVARDLGGHHYRRIFWTVGPDGPQVQRVEV